jgi:hypothetical protein
MSEDEIIKKVRDILNEHGGDDAISIATDRVLLEDYIKSAIPDAVVMLAQKGHRVNFCKLDYISDGRIAIPENFISLLCLKLDTWKKAVNRIVEVGSPEYLMAMNEFTKPGPNSPVCYRENDTLVCLPIGNIGIGAYNGTFDAGEGLEAEPKEATAVCYMTAALVLGMFGDDQGKQRLSDISINMLQ